MTDQQQAIVKAIIAMPHATLTEVARATAHISRGFLTRKQVGYAMTRFGITRERYKGAGYQFIVPDEVKQEVERLSAPTISNKIDRVWTRPMTVYPNTHRVVSL